MNTPRKRAGIRFLLVAYGLIAIAVTIMVIAFSVIAPKPVRPTAPIAAPPITPDIEKAPPAPRTMEQSLAVMDAYIAHFRRLRERYDTLDNAALDKRVREELPALVKQNAAFVAAILDEDAPRIAAVETTALLRKMTALFVSGDYYKAFQIGASKRPNWDKAETRVVGDAAWALYIQSPGKSHLDSAFRYYTITNMSHGASDTRYTMAGDELSLARACIALDRKAPSIVHIQMALSHHAADKGTQTADYAFAVRALARAMKKANISWASDPAFQKAFQNIEDTLSKPNPNIKAMEEDLGVIFQVVPPKL